MQEVWVSLKDLTQAFPLPLNSHGSLSASEHVFGAWERIPSLKSIRR